MKIKTVIKLLSYLVVAFLAISFIVLNMRDVPLRIPFIVDALLLKMTFVLLISFFTGFFLALFLVFMFRIKAGRKEREFDTEELVEE